MPIVYQHTINKQSQLGIWQIDEPLVYFTDRLKSNSSYKHPSKLKQHLAGRHLLTQLIDGFPVEDIMIASSGKPFLPDSSLHFSISHCEGYAAAIISADGPVGIDIELIRSKVSSIIRRFLSEDELSLLPDASLTDMLTKASTLCWSAKESLFKWYGEGGVDFSKHLRLLEVPVEKEGSLQAIFQKEDPVEMKIAYRMEDMFVLSWTKKDL